jgi:hypothetical protein
MAVQHEQKPGTGVAYYDPPEKRKSEKAPDYTGFITLEMDYQAGDKLKFGIWEKQTSSGYTLLSLREDNWSKKQNMLKEEERDTPREVQPRVIQQRPGFNRPALQKPKNDPFDDSEIPF